MVHVSFCVQRLFLIKLNITQTIEGLLSFCGVVELNVGFSEKIHR